MQKCVLMEDEETMGQLTSGLRSRSGTESEAFGWSGISYNTRVGVGFFVQLRSECPLGSFFTSHSQIRNSWWNGTISFETFVEADISCCASRFPLILTAKFHSFYVKESETLERSELESDIVPPSPQPRLTWWDLKNETCKIEIMEVICKWKV